MKKILTLFAILFTMNMYATVTDSTNIQISETERIIDKYGEKVVESFNSLIETTTPLAEEGFKIVVRLQILKGIINTLPILFLILTLIIFKKEYFRISKLLNSDDIPENMNKLYNIMSENNGTVILWSSFITGILLTMLTTFTISKGLQQLFIPEWFAIQEILHLFK